MFRASQRRTLEAIDTQAITPIVPLARSDLKPFIAQSKSIELSDSHDIARGGTFLAREVAALIKKAAVAK
jgi:hypothetical protein